MEQPCKPMNVHMDYKVMLVANNIWRNWSLDCEVTCFILSNSKAISFYAIHKRRTGLIKYCAVHIARRLLGRRVQQFFDHTQIFSTLYNCSKKLQKSNLSDVWDSDGSGTQFLR